MHLIRDDIVTVATQFTDLFCRRYIVPKERLYEWEYWTNHLPPGALADYSHAVDYDVTGWIARQAQTFVFDHEQILAFLAAVDRRLPPGDYPAPFPYMIIQFSRGIDERLFTTGLRLSVSGSLEEEEYEDDEILGLIIAMPDDDATPRANVIAWYKSSAVHRVQLPMSGDGEIRYVPPTTSHDSNVTAAIHADKQRIANLALLSLAYIHSPGIEVEHVRPDPRVNRKRSKSGKRELPDYYICQVRREQRARQDAQGESVRHVSFRFDVSGHFRRLADGRTIWIKAHQRGLEHEMYKPKIYKVD